MATSDPVVGAFEAKTRLAQLLRETERGVAFVIERRGRPVARLVPYDARRERTAADDWTELLAALREVRGRVRGGPVDVRALVEEGRR